MDTCNAPWTLLVALLLALVWGVLAALVTRLFRVGAAWSWQEVVIGVAVACFVLLAIGSVARAADAEPACTHYAAQTGPLAPVSAFWDEASPGSTLCLLPGIYRGADAMLVPPRGLSGEAGAPITVRALTDGTVSIDGQGVRPTLSITGSHWRVEGVDVYGSSVCSICLEDAHHVSLRRVVAWRDPGNTADPNTMVVSVSKSSDVTIEDVGAFGNARKVVQVYRSLRVTLRRVWARWDGRDPGHTSGNEFAVSAMYRSYDSLAENVLATSSGSREVWLLATDWWETTGIDTLYWALDRAPNDTRYRLLGSAAYSQSPALGLLVATGQAGVEVANVAVSVVPGSTRTALLHPCEGCTVDRLTTGGGRPGLATKRKIDATWAQTGPAVWDGSRPGAIYSPPDGNGGRLCHQTVDGVLSAEPLWPWPMQDRIAAATQRSPWPDADVTAEFETAFGAPPAECTR